MESTKPSRRRLRIALLGAAVVIGLPLAAATVFVLTFDAERYKPRIVDAARRATGRELVLAGPLSLAPSLYPTFEAKDVALANMAGGSRPQMLSIGRLQVRVALLPLLRRRVEIESVTLTRPDILIETDAGGRGNWMFQRPAPALAEPPAAAGPSGSRTETDLRRVRVREGRLTWRNGATGRSVAVDVPAADADFSDGPLRMTATLGYAATPFALELDAGTLAQLRGDAPGAWPVNLRLSQADAVATVAGTMELPVLTHGYRGRADAIVPDTARLAALLGRPDLPALHDVRAGAAMNSVAGVPAFGERDLHVGGSDLSSLAPRLQLARLDAAWPKPDQQMRVAADGELNGAPWRLATGVMPVAHGVELHGLSLAVGGEGGASDLAGELAVMLSAVPSVRGALVSQRLDVDALRRLFHVRPAPAAAPSPPASAPVADETPPRVISDRPLPFAALRRADGDLQVTVGDLRAGGADYRGLAGHAVLQHGALTLDPFTVQAPEGRIDLSFSTDASQSPPPVALALRSPAFALGPLLQSLDAPGNSVATVEIDVALRSAGSSPRALAAALDGHAGLAVVDGEIENALLTRWFAGVLRSAHVPEGLAGRSHVRCLALRLDASHGKVDVRTLTLDSTRLRLTGSGTADLGAESLALQLLPELQFGGTGVAAPMRVGGTFAHPQAALESSGEPGRTGVVIGGAPREDSCGSGLASARDGRAGPVPAAVRAAKPADLLRSLLR